MSEIVNVVLCGDQHVLWGIAVAVRSSLEQSSSPLAITVITSGISDADKEALSRSWEHPNAHSVKFAEMDYAKLRHFRSTKYLKSKLTYARYFIEDFLPDAERLIYIDTDMIVLDDLTNLWRTDLEGNTVGVVLDISTRGDQSQVEYCARLNIKDADRYFNGGTLLIDMNEWKASNAKDRLIQVSVDMFDAMDASDQGALNVVFEGKSKVLDVKWNTVQYEAPDSFSGGILHLIGPTKPWHYDYDYKFKGLFYEYLDRTAFAGMRPPAPRSLAALREKVWRKIPTVDMVVGKLRRTFLKRDAAGPVSAQPLAAD